MNSYELRKFYKTTYDWERLAQFVTDNYTDSFAMIEFGFRFNDPGSFMRRIYFSSVNHLKEFCIQKLPKSVELGMTCPPPGCGGNPLTIRDYVSKRHTEFIWRKPLIFDWDIDHELRVEWGQCGCAEKDMCHLCWEAFAEPAKQCLERTLTHWLGYQNLMCVFSGGRGFHMWVLDRELRNLSSSQRKTLIRKISNPIESEAFHIDMLHILQPIYEKHHKDAPYEIMSIFYDLDEAVTYQKNHMSGLPWFPHRRTGRLRVTLDGNPFKK